jgi:predicted amidohydrolase YtcJ
LAVGALADLIVLERPLDGLSPEEIAQVRPEATLFGGQLVYGAL